MIRAGIDIGGSFIKAGLVDESNGKILMQSIVPFPSGKREAEVWDLLHNQVEVLFQESHSDFSDLCSLGVAVPGSIDAKGETILHAHNLNFHQTPIKKALEKKFPETSILILNDANAAALAEHRFGALKGADTAVLITLGTGVGGALILGGKLFNGGNGNGVEIGHMTLKYDGNEHNCNNNGCFEMYCASSALSRGGGSWKCAEEVFIAAKLKDSKAAGILESYVEALSSAVVSLTNILDPEIIAIGGGISNAGDALLEPLRKKVKEKSFFKKDYKIVQASLGNNAGIVGAAIAFQYVSQSI